jgi:polyferredoxin
VYTVRIINKDEAPHSYILNVDGLPTLSLETDPPVIDVAAGVVYTVAARVLVEDGAVASGGHDISFTLSAQDGSALQRTERARFFTP